MTGNENQGAAVERIITREHHRSSTPVLWRCPSCPLILVGPQIKRAGQHVKEHEAGVKARG